ncbi:MAG: DUF5663 domain-containing protein [Patescibacteria group bacterium]|jgi:succinate dehydrogenase flavin-adding protein (antitoxin of CptAB toxin-antitoxin module)
MPKWIDEIDPESLIDKDIFELLDLKDAPEDRKHQILEDMMETIQNRVVARILDSLKKEEVKEFEELLDEDDNDKVAQFLQTRNIDPVTFTAEEALNYKIEILNLIAAQEDASDADNQAQDR